jgi:hypothetical protein
MSTSQYAIEAAITEEFISPTKFCQKFGFAHATLSVRIRKGDIALHQFFGEGRPKVNVAEALKVMSAVKRQYASPTLRIVRHDEEGVVDARPEEKADLFS